MDTLVVNLFGGPGSGKSTGATYVFSRLKMLGYHCEYVSEFAKDLVWEGNKDAFDCQMYITGNQAWRIRRLIGKVDVIITDSPICIGNMYNKDNPALHDAIMFEFNKYHNINFYIERANEYEVIGRNENESTARKIDENLKHQILDRYCIDYQEVMGNIDGYDIIYNTILNILLFPNSQK